MEERTLLFDAVCEEVFSRLKKRVQSLALVSRDGSSRSYAMGSISLSMKLRDDGVVEYCIEGSGFKHTGTVGSVADCDITVIHDAKSFLFGHILHTHLRELCVEMYSVSVTYSLQTGNNAKFLLDSEGGSVRLRLALSFDSENLITYSLMRDATTLALRGTRTRKEAFGGILRAVGDALGDLRSKRLCADLNAINARLGALFSSY
jgi:hypothetical protein